LKRNRHRLPELIEETRKRMQPCRLCERQCKVNRLSGETGFCGLEHRLRLFACSNLYNEGLLVGSPTLGIYLSGCAFRCRTCYRQESWDAEHGTLFTPEHLAAMLDDAATSGSRSWMFLGGNPDQSVLGILEALQFTKSDTPVVWNTALWSTPEILTVLREIVDIWIIDIKFGNNECAVRESGVSDYVETIARNIELLKDEAHVIFRHGVQREHGECCTAPIRCRTNQIGRGIFLEHVVFERTRNGTPGTIFDD
jgi:putative pyruvate formate lyase activating enzyme